MSQKKFYFQSSEKPKELIKSVFDADISVSGGWGYSLEDATIIEDQNIPIKQLEHTIASMRTHLEMSITQEKDNRYGGINLKEIDRQEYIYNDTNYHKVTYEIDAIKESLYNKFISEYKEQYGKDNFDLSNYFMRRQEATLKRVEIYYFIEQTK